MADINPTLSVIALSENIFTSQISETGKMGEKRIQIKANYKKKMLGIERHK